MKKCYDFSKGVRRPEIAAQLRQNGYRVTITDGEDGPIIEQYTVSPEVVQARHALREQKRQERVSAD
ncbi:MAG: hypothetical protein FWD35_02410 [Oscillospiraceae bacterium]|nr:hypothetical protein [Oscillospiraceae bacterium]